VSCSDNGKSTIRQRNINMKKAVFLIFLASAFGSRAQDMPVPFKGANVIVIDTGLPADEAYKKIGQKMVSEGFSIDVNNKEFHQMKTGPVVLSDYNNLKYQVTATVDNKGRVKLKAMIDMGPPIHETEWTWYKAKGTKYHVVHDDILKKLNGLGTVLYSKS
jgi:hypothetical protein